MNEPGRKAQENSKGSLRLQKWPYLKETGRRNDPPRWAKRPDWLERCDTPLPTCQVVPQVSPVNLDGVTPVKTCLGIKYGRCCGTLRRTTCQEPSRRVCSLQMNETFQVPGCRSTVQVRLSTFHRAAGIPCYEVIFGPPLPTVLLTPSLSYLSVILFIAKIPAQVSVGKVDRRVPVRVNYNLQWNILHYY